LRLYIKGNPLSGASKSQLKELEEIGMRVNR